MTAPLPPRSRAATDLNLLQRGSTYQADTCHGTTTGEYLGMETPYGCRAILLRHRGGTDSVAVSHITAIHLAA